MGNKSKQAVQVNIRRRTENIRIPGPLGTQSNQQRESLQLYIADTGELVSDGNYVLKQENQSEHCSIYNGELRGADWTDETKSLFLLGNQE